MDSGARQAVGLQESHDLATKPPPPMLAHSLVLLEESLDVRIV